MTLVRYRAVAAFPSSVSDGRSKSRLVLGPVPRTGSFLLKSSPAMLGVLSEGLGMVRDFVTFASLLRNTTAN